MSRERSRERERERSRERDRSPEDARRPDRPIYCGNYEYELPETEIRRLFEDIGRVDRIDMKTGFCFVYMQNERDAERAIRKLHNLEVGRRGRPLRLQWAKTKEVDRQREVRPSSTLFVVNFDLARTRERDIEHHFKSFGPIKRVEIKKSYAFVQFEKVEDAEYALKKTHLSNLEGRTITVEYVQNEDPNAARMRGPPPPRDDYGRGGYDRGGDGGYDRPRRRSPSPLARGRSRSRERERDFDRAYDRDAGADRGREYDRGRDRSRSPRRGRSYSR